MGVTKEMVDTAQRYQRWVEIQSQHMQTNGRAERDMETRRVRFSGSQRLDVDPNVFLESVLEGNDLMPVRYFEMGMLASRPIGRIQFDLGPRIGHGFATGFLVAPGLLLTNYHVLPSADVAKVASVTFDAEDRLDGLPKRPQVFKLTPHRGYISDRALDFCFVAVEPSSTDGHTLSDYGYLRLHQGTGKIMREEYATIVQHPRGRQKQVAARNNKITVYVYDKELTDTDQIEQNNHLYYETDTLPGSSGAPVFSDQWYVVALHRRGVPKTKLNAQQNLVAVRRDGTEASPGDPDDVVEFIANEGVRVSRIIRRLEAMRGEGSPEQKLTASQVIAKIQATTIDKDSGPFAVPVAPINRLSESDPALSGELELTRRSLQVFADAPGFDEEFLGVTVRMPELSEALMDAAAMRIDDPTSYYLPFMHFTTVMHAQRRLPIFAAVNIDGRRINPRKKPGRPAWSYDPRIDETQQPDDSIFSDMVQRGHMGAREFMWWGKDDEALLADKHSFTLTNVCPQIGGFNGHLEWFKLERQLFQAAKGKKQRVNCFMGPVFSRSDQLYDDLRSIRSSAAEGTGIRMPRRFWYLLVWMEANSLMYRGFILDQSDDIEEAGPLEFDFETPALVKDADLDEIEQLSKLTFVDLH